MFDLHSINHGFSGKATVYDDYGARNPIVRWGRAQVRAEVLKWAQAGDSLLELNAGTGADAAFFAERGLRVHATDVAEGMLAAMRQKAAQIPFSTQRVSFTDLDQVLGGPYDVVFSNFGGLNCVSDLRWVTRGLPQVLKPGGVLVWVIMPPLCVWEVAQALRGQFRTAFRRWQKGGTPTHVEGAHFLTYYFTSAQVLAALGPGYQCLTVRGLSVFSPPSYLDNFPHRFPRLTQWLMSVDERLGHWPLVNVCGDFFVLTARRESGD